MLMDLAFIKTLVLFFSLIVLYTLEIVIPFYAERKEKLVHDARNVTLGIINAALVSILFTSLALAVSVSSFALEYGLFKVISLPWIVEIVLVLIAFDLWMYGWHVANHKIPFLWKFHRVHHSDTDMDASSALRFHPVEIVLSSIARLGIIALLGLELWHIVMYEIVLLPVIAFHHSNVRFIEKYDRVYRLIFASPHMHRIHHSDIQVETDSNYTSIFSFWDRLFGTFRLSKDPAKITLGLKEYREKKWHSLWGMVKTPFSKR